MENLEEDMRKLLLDLLSKEVQGQEKKEEKIDNQNPIQGKQDAVDKSGKGSTSTSSTTSVVEQKLALCPVCQSKADKTCGGCKSVSYCSVEHQRLDWKSHKKCCSPFIINESETTTGKEWIATRDLPADTILLEESPLLFYPKWDGFDSPCCLSCGIAMIQTQRRNRKCSTCSWPICSEKCEKSSCHAENECKFFSTHKLKYSISLPIPFGSVILLIRASNLKLKNKKGFDEMMKLQDFQPLPIRNDQVRTEGLLFCIQDQSILSLTHLTKDEYAKLIRIVAVNSFSEAPSVDKKLGELTSLYLQSSRINHSCAPNCIGNPGTSPDFKMRVRTAIPVKKGESITISYYGQLKLQPTFSRQQYLQNEIGFQCKCQRCLDPTELGTFMTGIKCQKCRRPSKKKMSKADENSGYFLASNPLDWSLKSALFKCNGCKEEKPFSVLKASLPSEVQRAFDIIDIGGDDIIEDAEDFLAKYNNESGGNYLHKNHYLIHTLVEKIVPSPTKIMGFRRHEMQRAVRRREYLLEIHQMLFPGLADRKAVLFVELMLTVCRVLERFPREISPREIKEYVVTAQTCFKEGNKYFKKDNSANGQWMPQKLQDGMNLIKSDFFLWMDPSI